MRYVKNIMIVLVIGLFVSGTAFAADLAGALTVGDGSGGPESTVSLAITLDDNDGDVAGVAFTLTYDADSFAFAGLEAVASQAIANPEDVTAVDASTLYYQANGDTAGEVMVAAASASAINAGIIFNVKFTVNADATDGDYDIGIKKSTISNTSAGYDANGEEIDALVGLPDGDTFAPTLTGGTLTVSGVVKGDPDGDGDTDVFDLLTAVDFMNTADDGSAAFAACDTDDDGDVDVFDLLAMVDLM